MGFRLYVPVEDTPTAEILSINNVDAMINTAICSSTVTKYTCLRPSQQGLVPCLASDARDADKCVGIAIEDAVLDVDTNTYSVRYMLQGIVESSLFNFTPGQSIWVGYNGSMTAQSPMTTSQAAFMQRIGKALSSKVVQVSIEPAVLKNEEI